VAPTGHYRAGTVRLHLVDPTRIDPTSPTQGIRELMVQIWYPATDTRGFPSTPYLTPLAAAHFLAINSLPPGTTLPQTTGHVGASADRRDGPYPVVLYSPGGEADASLDTGLVEDLVGHGYVVVTMDDTNESSEVEFPGGRLVTGTFVPETDAQSLEAQQIRAADASFVLNELAVLTHGGNPDAEHAPLPAGLAGSLNLSRVGMFGWSLGGAASAQAMHDDPRIKAAINMDGRFWGPLAQEGVNRPFLLLTGSEHTEQNDPTLASFLAASMGPTLHLALANSQHPTFTDAEELEPELAPALGLTPDQVAADLGTISPKTAVTDERAYIRAFFDKYVRNRDNHLLDGPSPRFPDIQFEP
jgi:predicted dienelactone hydrolase